MKLYEIVGCFNCEQVQFLITPMLKTGLATLNQGLQDVNICLCLTGLALVSVQLQHVTCSQEHDGTNQRRIYQQFLFWEKGKSGWSFYLTQSYHHAIL